MMEDDPLLMPEVPPTNNAWMITFSDLISLLLTFFVMMFAMSDVKIDKWKNLTDTLSKNLNPARVDSSAIPTAVFNIDSLFRKPAINLDYLAGILEESISADPSLAGTNVIRMPDSTLR